MSFSSHIFYSCSGLHDRDTDDERTKASRAAWHYDYRRLRFNIARPGNITMTRRTPLYLTAAGATRANCCRNGTPAWWMFTPARDIHRNPSAYVYMRNDVLQCSPCQREDLLRRCAKNASVKSGRPKTSVRACVMTEHFSSQSSIVWVA